MKINHIIALSSLLFAVSCQSTASTQRTVSVVGMVPMSGTSTIEGTVGGIPVSAEGDVDRSGVAVRLESRDGAIGKGVEVRNASYENPTNNAESDGIELAGFFRRYLDDGNNSLYLEASPILGLGLENDSAVESSTYALLRVALGYRWMLDENIFIDADAGYYMTLMTMDYDDPLVTTETEVSGVGVSLALGMTF